MDNIDEKFSDLVAGELKKMVLEIMNDLKPKYREILVMRCYEEMEYKNIAEELGCSEFSARVLFFRAKNKLHKCFKKRGLG